MAINYRQYSTAIADATEFDYDDSTYASSAENCLAEWATGSDETGNLVINGNALAENLRADCF